VLVGSVGRPKPRSPAGHRAEVSEHAGVSETREVGDDRRGRPVSERERESERARAGPRCWAARASAGASTRVRASGPLSGPSRKERRIGPSSVFVFLFQNFE